MEILNLITPTKTLYPNEVIFTGRENLDLDIFIWVIDTIQCTTGGFGHILMPILRYSTLD